MERFEHGGDTYALPGVLDFSASVNPLGLPREAVEALRTHAEDFSAYPDPHCRDLKAALASFEGVAERWVLPCAGATDAIWRLCAVLRPMRALVCAPCYAGYEEALAQVGTQVTYHHLHKDEGFAAGPDLADAIVEGIDLVFLANPNNPTGLCLDRSVLASCLDRAREVGAVVVLDECFVELAGRRGSADLLLGNPHLVIVKALTKTYALAGLRVGYALCADESLLERMRRAGQPWAVSTPAQVAGVACLRDGDYLQRSLRLIGEERASLRVALAALGLDVVPGVANYLLFEGPEGLREELLERGVLVRTCENFVGLGPRWYRVAVRTHDENERLLAALEEAMR